MTTEQIGVEDAKEYSESLAQIGEGWWRQIRWAQRLGIPAALGMTDREWAEVYHGYLRLAIEDRREAVNELLEAEPDLTNQEIGDALGVSDETARRDRQATTTNVVDGSPDLGEPQTTATNVAAPLPLVEEEAPPSDLPPLTEDETSISGADIALGAVAEEYRSSPLDERPTAQQQREIIDRISTLAGQLEGADVVIRVDALRDVDVLAARSAVRRLVTNATSWLRRLNSLYSQEAQDA